MEHGAGTRERAAANVDLLGSNCDKAISLPLWMGSVLCWDGIKREFNLPGLKLCLGHVSHIQKQGRGEGKQSSLEKQTFSKANFSIIHCQNAANSGLKEPPHSCSDS